MTGGENYISTGSEAGRPWVPVEAWGERCLQLSETNTFLSHFSKHSGELNWSITRRPENFEDQWEGESFGRPFSWLTTTKQ